MRLAIDDVGAGFSSLRHIVLTAPDVIKIDRSLVDGVHHDKVLRTLVAPLGEFATGLGAAVVAEGIEDIEDANALQECGIGYGQGWHFGRPGPAADLGPGPARRSAPSAKSPAGPREPRSFRTAPACRACFVPWLRPARRGPRLRKTTSNPAPGQCR